MQRAEPRIAPDVGDVGDVGRPRRDERTIEQAAITALDADDVDALRPRDRVAARIAAFIPGASPPRGRMPVRWTAVMRLHAFIEVA